MEGMGKERMSITHKSQSISIHLGQRQWDTYFRNIPATHLLPSTFAINPALHQSSSVGVPLNIADEWSLCVFAKSIIPSLLPPSNFLWPNNHIFRVP
jgi:hypothetical protein